MQIASDPASLLVLHGHQADGKAPQFVRPAINHSFQFSGVVANRLLQQLTVVNVGAGSVPFNDLPFRISNRNRARSKPSVSAVSRAKAILAFVTPSRLNALRPTCFRSTYIVAMHMFEPVD